VEFKWACFESGIQDDAVGFEDNWNPDQCINGQSDVEEKPQQIQYHHHLQHQQLPRQHLQQPQEIQLELPDNIANLLLVATAGAVPSGIADSLEKRLQKVR
jgi:hypothetical protein